MGYSTDFTGVLKFKNEITGAELGRLNRFLGKDRDRVGVTYDEVDNEQWRYGKQWLSINLQLTYDFSGIEWNGQEKTADLDGVVNFLIDRSGVNLQLAGELLAQGENYDDRWRLVMKDGRAVREESPRIGQHVVCPLCDGEFTLED